MFFYRSTSRAIIIQYEPLDEIYQGEEKTSKLTTLRTMQNNAPSLVGRMIYFATHIYSPENFAELDGNVAAQISEPLSHCMARISETYPVWLYTLYKV